MEDKVKIKAAYYPDTFQFALICKDGTLTSKFSARGLETERGLDGLYVVLERKGELALLPDRSMTFNLPHLVTAPEEQQEEKKVFESGAQRSADSDQWAFHLIHWEFLADMAKVLRTGAQRYGAHNWEKGMPIEESANHLIKHVYQWLNGDDSEDHLANAACNLMFMKVMAKLHPELLAKARRLPGGYPSPGQLRCSDKADKIERTSTFEEAKGACEGDLSFAEYESIMRSRQTLR